MIEWSVKVKIGDVEWTEREDWSSTEIAELPGGLRLMVIDGCDVPDDPEAARPCWYVEGGDDASGWGVLASGKADSMTAARIAAYDGWREWVREQGEAVGLIDAWISVDERLPEHHVEVLVASVHGMTFQAVGMWHGVADEIIDFEPGWIVWNRPFTYKPDFVTHWRPLPPMP